MEVITPLFRDSLSQEQEQISHFSSQVNTTRQSATKLVRPIMNLVCTVRPHFVADAIFSIRHRLLPDSTVVVVTPGLGTMEEIIDANFPDPHTRPCFRSSLANHSLFEMVPGSESKSKGDKDALKDWSWFVNNNKAASLPGFSIYDNGGGVLSIDKSLAIDQRSTGKAEVLLRMRATQYLVSQLLGSPRLSAVEVSHSRLLFYRYVKKWSFFEIMSATTSAYMLNVILT